MKPIQDTFIAKIPFLLDIFTYIKTSRSSKLVTNATIYVAGSLLQKALNFLLVPLYVQYLTPSDYGILGFLLSLQGVLSIILGLGIYAALTRFYYDKEIHDYHGFVTTNLLIMLFWGVGATVLINRFGEPIWYQITSGQVAFSPYVHLSCWVAFVSTILQVPLTLYRAAQKAKGFVVAQLAVFLLRIVMILWFVVVKEMGVYGQLVGQLLAGAISTVFLLGLLLREYAATTVKWSYLKTSLAYSLPLLPHLLLAWVLNASDRMLLESRVSMSELGLYNLASQLGLFIQVLVTSINQAWTPYYFDIMPRDSYETGKIIKKAVKFYAVVIGSICLIGVLFSTEIIRWLIPDNYLGTERYVPLILLAYLFRGGYYFTSSPLFYYKRTNLVTLVTLLSGVVGVSFNLWAIPRWGALGAATALVLAYLSSFILAHLLGKKEQRIKLPGIFLVSMVLVSASVVFAIGSSLWFAINSYVLFGIKLIIISVYIYFLSTLIG